MARGSTRTGDRLQLRRIMTSGSWIPQIDGLRFVAIVSVVLFHILGQLEVRTGYPIAIQPRYSLLARLLSNGDRGVLLFFVISGFILARPFLRQHRLLGKPVDIGHYYLRRVTRLEPPYIVALLLYTAAFVAYGVPLGLLLPHLVASVFYLHGLIYRAMSPIDFVVWSLEVEVQFYLLAPLLGAMYLLRNAVLRRSLLVALILAAGVFSIYSNRHESAVWHWTILGYLHYFLTGFLLADIVEGHQQQAYRSVWWDAVSLAGWPVVFLLPRVLDTLAWLPILIFPLYVAAFYGPASNRFFRTPFVALGGGMCYSIYLTHMLVISVVFKATRHLAVFRDFLLNYTLQIATLGFSVALIGTLYFVLIERPCMDPHWPNKVWRRIHRAAGSSPPS
ncbi:MAG: acyltransferase [Acidobacteriaceae bacterium]|jgi:peptidoglycan/LPS O-acetylase OafA/YrhL